MNVFSVGQTVKWTGLTFTIHSFSENEQRAQLVNPEGLYSTAPVTELSFVVTITYFKTSGKYYTEDEAVEWRRDVNHFTGWQDFSAVVRLRDMFAVCMETPLGYPTFHYPQQSDALDHVDTVVGRLRQGGEPRGDQLACAECHGTRSRLCGSDGHLHRCLRCNGRGTVDAPVKDAS